MAFNRGHLAVPLNLGLIGNVKSYWASHFYAIIQCLHSHKALMYSPMQMGAYPNWKLRDLRADLPVNFFYQIDSYLQNWGFQYFMSTYLNMKMSRDLVDQIIDRLSRLYDAAILRNYLSYRFFLAGADSILSAGLLDEFTGVFPPRLNSLRPNARFLAQQTDLCLVLTFPIPYAKLAIFGEVEGLHGNEMSNFSYWKRKLPFSVLAVGVIDGPGKNAYLFDTSIDGVDRVNLIFERSNFVVQDFQKALDFMRRLFLDGPTAGNFSGDEEFGFFCNLIKQFWSRNTIDLLNELGSYSRYEDLIGFTSGPLATITDIQAQR